MPFDPIRVAEAVASGLSIVCATCEKYWKARDLNIPDGKCLSTSACGSPICGNVFTEYAGPMTQFDQFCFVCGNSATHALRVNGYVRVIGCCASHVELVKTLRPENSRPVSVVVISREGEKASD